MISNDERREVAERLRWLASKQGTYKGVLGSDVLVPLRLLSADHPGFMPRKSVARLADFIDPTCEMKSISKSSYRVCLRCGAFVRKDAATDCTKAIPVRFCPNCGARVVRGDE